jgi:hypothetical protein
MSEDLADMRMIQRRNRTSLLLKAGTMLGLQSLRCDDTIQACVPSLPDFSHAAGTDKREDFTTNGVIR